MDTINETALTPLAFLERSARLWTNKTAVIDGKRRLSYAEFGDRAQQLSRALAASGVRPGDRVAVLMPNVTEMLLAHFAVPLAGAILMAVNTRLSPDEVRYILEHSGVRMLLVDHRLAGLATAAAEGLTHAGVLECAVTEGGQQDHLHTAWGELLGRAAGQPPLAWEVADERTTIAINYTSGTTGRPKGVLYTHRGAYLNSFGELLHSRHSTGSVLLWTLPMFHCNGWCMPWALTAIGGVHVCLPEVRGEAIWAALREHGVTHLNAAPTVLTTMMEAPEAGPLTAPVVVSTAGAPPSPTTIRQLTDLGFDLVHVYGLTETYGPYAVCEVQPEWAVLDAEQRSALLARQGVGMIQAERLRVVDEEMRDVPMDGASVGEIVMRGNNVMQGYYRDPESTAEAFRGGWFHSGDLGVVHPDGYVELRDRAKDVVISGGENISTVEVEQALMSHPAVLEAAVVGVPDDRWGESPKGYVVLRTGHDVDGPALISHVRSRIAHYKAPREVEVLPTLPKTSTGKIQKFVLREEAWAGRESRVQG
ncbi:long-chain-fatty-acid--CoA ligase [Nocardioides sp. NPDC047086]|uniref:long-chain-fatty-acid--CoA ligase n=1 Tax=Nocardioides sp. NPDC047086 TaxID=3154810 RepID=UPI0034005721